MYRLSIYDEIFPSPTPSFAMMLDLPSTTTTAKEIIKERIKSDCLEQNLAKEQTLAEQKAKVIANYQAKMGELTEHEKALNGDKLPKFFNFQFKKEAILDWEVEYEKAITAFLENGFILIIDDEQITDLDTPIVIKENHTSKVTFLKLIPLQGG